MRHGQSGGFALFASAIVAADAFLLHATALQLLGAFWEFPPALQAASAGAAGFIGSSVLALGTDRRGLTSALLVFLAGLSWVAATAIGDWAETDGIIGGQALPQWWYVTRNDSSAFSGLMFSSGQAISGAVAGVGLVLPVWFDRTRTLRQRTLHAVVLVAVVALTWTVMFHARWFACGLGFVAPEPSVVIAPRAA